MAGESCQIGYRVFYEESRFVMLEKQFEHISLLIEEARRRAFQSVNHELILLYWKIGQYVSQQVAEGQWGDGTAQQLADYLSVKHPSLKGFNRRGLYRIMQFYEAYKNDEIVSSLMTQISWTHHVNILDAACRQRSLPDTRHT
jgi:hypothetical protein